MLAQSMSTPIWHVDLPTAESFVNSLMSNPDVIRVRVEDAALGPVIVVENRSLPGENWCRRFAPCCATVPPLAGTR